MKTILPSLSLLLTLTSISAYAQPVSTAENNPGITATDASIATQKIFARIQQHMRVPESMKGVVSSERVRIVFTIDEKGNANVLDVGTRCPELIGSVISQFEALGFPDSRNTNGQEFSIWLNFTVM